MSNILGVLKVLIEGDTSKLDSAVNDAEKKTGGLTKSIADIGKTAAGVAVGVGLTQLPGILTSAAQAAADDEAATIRLSGTLENLVARGGGAGRSVEDLMRSMDGAIKSGQELAFTDDEVRDSMQFLINATDDYDEATRRSAVAMDLARGANIPLAQATKLVGKISEENVDTLRKLGIEMDDNATEADALAAIQAKFAGQAEKYGDSTAGQFAKSQIAMSEAKEELGQALLPLMVLLGDVLSTVVVPALEAMTPLVEGFAKGITFIVENAEPLAPILIAVGGVMLAVMLPALISLTVATWAYVAALVAQAIAFAAANIWLILIVAGIALLVAGIVWLVQNWEKIQPAIDATIKWLTEVMWPAMKKYLYDEPKRIVEEIIAFFDSTYQNIKNAPQAVIDWFTNTFFPAVKDYLYDKPKGVVEDIIGFFDSTFENIKNAPQAVLDWLTGTFVPNVTEYLYEKPKGVIEDIISWVTSNFARIQEGPQEFINWLTGFFTNTIQTAWNGVETIFNTAWTNIKNATTTSIGELIALVAEIPGKMIAALGDLYTMMYNAGRDAMQGLVDGIRNMIGAVAGAVGEVAGGAINTIKSLGRSPWPATIQSGKDFSEGFAVGITKGTNEVVDAASKLSEDALNEVYRLSVEGIASAYSIGDAYGAVADKIKAAGLPIEHMVYTTLDQLRLLIDIEEEYRSIMRDVAFEDELNRVVSKTLPDWQSGMNKTRDQMDAMADAIEKAKRMWEGGWYTMEQATAWANDHIQTILGGSQMSADEWANKFRDSTLETARAWNDLDDFMRFILGENVELQRVWAELGIHVYEDFSVSTRRIMEGLEQTVGNATDGIVRHVAEIQNQVAAAQAAGQTLMNTAPTGGDVPEGYWITPQGNVAKIPGNAQGTRWWQGGLSMVGECGPELINLPRGSRVWPTDKTRQILMETVNVYARDEAEGRASVSGMGYGLYQQMRQRGLI